MDNDNFVYRTESDATTAWFVGIIVALALLSIAYLVIAGFSEQTEQSKEKAVCEATHPDAECRQITRWEPATPPTEI